MNTLSEAVALYVGVGFSSYPKEDETRLARGFGEQVGRDLAMRVQTLLVELRKIEPDWKDHTLASGSKWAVDQLRRQHAELDDKAASALEWTYSWWWK